MAISGSSSTVARVGPLQDVAYVAVDIAAAGPNAETYGKALATVNVGADGVAVAGASAAQIGIVTETAPASDTASSGLNGRLQRIAQRLTSLIALVPTAIGPQTAAASLAVVQSGYSFSHIATATTTTAKSGAGVLHTISVNALGTVASTTTVYDNTAGSGTVIAIINTLAGQETYVYDVIFATGLTLVTTGTVAPDITVSYR